MALTLHRAFCLLVIVLLLFELSAPIAYAQSLSFADSIPPSSSVPAAVTTPSTPPSALPAGTGAASSSDGTAVPSVPARPTIAGACTVAEISDAERKQLWNFLFSSQGGFRGDSLNDLDALESILTKQEDAISKKPTDKNAGTWTVEKVSELFGEKPEDVAKATGLWDKDNSKIKDNTFIPDDVLLKYASRVAANKGNGKYANALQTIQDSISGTLNTKQKQEDEKKKTAELAPFERYKVKLPGSGKEVSLAEMFQSQALDPTSCLLDGEYIQGRVSYAAILDKDLTYGTPSSVVLGGNYISPATKKPTPELTSTRKEGNSEVGLNQFLSGSSVSGYLNLNRQASGGGNLVVPEFYKDWITFTGKYTQADLYISLAASLIALGTVKDLRSAIKRKNDQIERVKGVREPNALTAKQIDEQLYGKIPQDGQGRFLLEDPRTLAGNKQAYSVGLEDVTQNGQQVGVLKYYDKAGQEVGAVPGVSNFDEILKKDPSLNFKRENGLTQDLHDADRNLERLRKIKDVSDSRLIASFMLAGGWLGPARLTFQDNAGIFFQIKNAKDAHYLRIESNKKVLQDFEDVSGILAMGKLQEFAARFVPLGVVPEKAFYPKSILLLNYPAPIKVAGTSVQTQDHTTFSVKSNQDSASLFEIVPTWSGNAYAENYEDIRAIKSDEYTSLAMVANGALPKPSLYEDNLKRFTSLFSLAIPFLATRKLFELQESALGTGVFLITLDFIDIDENIGKDDPCLSEDVEAFKDKYRLAFAGSVATSVLNYGVLLTLFEKANILSNVVGGFTTVTQWINPADLWRFYIGNSAITYTSNCREQMFTILAYQKVPERIAQSANTVTDKVPALNDALNKIGLSNLLGATERDQQAEKELKNLKEVLDFRAQLTNERGLVQTPELLYVHADDAQLSIPSDLYGLVSKSCSNLRLQSPDGRSVDFSSGLGLYDKDGNLVASFKDDVWKLRAMAQNRNTALARVIIPNKIIQGTFSGNTDTFMRVSSDGRATLVNPSCNLEPALTELLGRPIGADLTQALGKTLRVQTTQGSASILDGQIFFVGKNGFSKSAPAPEDVHNAISSTGALNVLNNGHVRLEGATTGGDDAGELVSVLGEHGALYYEASSRRFSLIIYSIFETSSQNIQGYTIKPKGNGVDINVQPKKGFEDSGNKLNAAIDKITGQDGITSFETKDKIYYITPDGKVLRVIDKNSGKATDYNINGPIRTDGQGNIIVPTDRGDFKFALSNDNGQPTLSAQGPDGLKEVLALLAARGENGILTFNPSTGAINVYNGQDVPLNPAFADKGIGYSNSGAGTVGVPANNPFLDPRPDSTKTDKTYSPISLPSVPDELPWAAAMLGIVLLGVVMVRLRE